MTAQNSKQKLDDPFKLIPSKAKERERGIFSAYCQEKRLSQLCYIQFTVYSYDRGNTFKEALAFYNGFQQYRVYSNTLR